MTCDFLLTEQYFNVFYVHDVAGLNTALLTLAPLFNWKLLRGDMGFSENVGLIFPMIASHLKTGFHDQQNHLYSQWNSHLKTGFHDQLKTIGYNGVLTTFSDTATMDTAWRFQLIFFVADPLKNHIISGWCSACVDLISTLMLKC